MLNLMKKKTATEKTAIQITPNQKATTTVANVAGKVKTGAFGVATGAGIAGTMMLQNEKGIRSRKAEQPVVEATATEVASEQTPAAPATPADPAPVDPAPAAQTNQDNGQSKSDAGKQQPNGNGQGANNKNGNNHAKAAK